MSPPFDRELPKPFSSTIDVDLCAMSDPGYIRTDNGDHYLVIRAGRALETVFSSLPKNKPGQSFEETAYGMIVADGAGLKSTGEIASNNAIFTLLNLALRTPDWQFIWGPKEKNTVMWRMKDRFRHVNAALLQQVTAHSALNGMCTSMTVALAHGDNLVIGHIGDSRAYLLRKGKLRRLTRDHTLAERLMEEGINPEDDRLLAELKNVLMQSLGANESDCHPDVHDHVLENGDQLLLCTDGLTDMVEETVIESVLAQEAPAMSACRNLIDLALSNGGRDNVTVVVAKFWIPQA